MTDLLAARIALIDMAQAVDIFSINEVLRDYQNTLERMVVDAANGNLKSGAMARQMRELILSGANEMAVEGLREGGDKEAVLDDEDKIVIRDWVLNQVSFVTDFVDAAALVASLKGDEKVSARDKMLERVQYWATSISNLGHEFALRAKGNPYLTYDGDDGEESCIDCQKYKGQRHKMSWWKDRGLLDRPNTNYECGRYQYCHHHFYDDDGEMVID